MKKFLNLFHRESSIRGASLVLIITLTLSNVLGLFRDRFLTKTISTFNLDIYYASFRIPDLVFNTLILGAITSAFIPIFSDHLAAKNQKEGYRITNSLINLALIFTIVSAIILFFLMPYITPLVVPKFDAGRMAETVKFSRLLMLTPIFFSLSYIIGGVLNSHKRFLAYSLSPLIYNGAIIIGAWFVAPRYGLIGVVYTVLIGSALHVLIQLPTAIRLGYRYMPVIDYSKNIQKILSLMLPRTISLGASQIMLIVYTAVASAMAAGSISAFNLANNIQTMPIIALGTSFATAVFPTLAQKISQNKEEEFSFYLSRALRVIGFLLIPSSVIFILLRAQIIRLILGSGKFSWDDTRMTALALGFFSISILAQGLIPLLARAFYALKDTKTPMRISIYTVIISVLIAFPLSKYMSVAGLALAFSIGSYFNAFMLIYYLRKTYPAILDKDLFFSYAKTTFISLLMGVVVWGSMHIAANQVNMSKFFGVLEQTVFACVVGLVTFTVLSIVLKQDELKWAFKRKIDGK
ncbi:MAG: murein biosynthesis integral membrane protein MurJ [Patescibacteria group bacterium]